MRAFDLALGESRFLLELAEECADLLPAFYPGAEAANSFADGTGRHRLTVRTETDGFRFTWTEPVSGRPTERRVSIPESALFALEEAIERQVIADATKLLALHGGAVSTPSNTCLILGDSQSGRSSTTFQLVELGSTFLCEEIALFSPETWRVIPYVQTLSLSESLLFEFAADFEIRGRRHRLLAPIVRYEPPDLPQGTDDTVPIDRVLLPRYLAGVSTSIRPVSPEIALPEVLGYSFPPNVDAETQFDRMIALLERVETIRFVYSNAASARRALAELFQL